ncbi:DUF5686 family protein [Mucilaginibacter sp.]|uniref:DUF5686 and carboxypeptidase-like regulatory domain-containing protein n=1 Tax=Mucilaginibacter sp. TaxID=1882438 RepID=UPI00283D4434|nr:DUF5686 family protein [Mucilaginibacter sp.]MDR3694793.1 DUF5686 family protein [Mucilaginibacter sp.]
MSLIFNGSSWCLRVMWCFLILNAETLLVNAQIKIVKGKITDLTTSESIPFATVAVKGTSIGTHTDFDGLYRLELQEKVDSITISCMGYIQKSVAISNGLEQTVNMSLKPMSNVLEEVRISPKGYINPAWRILKEVVLHKAVNDPQFLKSYQYESYNRIEFDASHLGENLLNKKGFNKVLRKADSLGLSGDERTSVLPLFVSETVSDLYYQSNPSSKMENIKRTRTNGVGFEDGTLMAQLTGSTFQQYNFYENFLSAAGKNFASPISDSWNSWYDYELKNRNTVVDGKICYEISFKPKRAKDLAFTGTIWIAKDNYALYLIKATIEPSANLNFIHRIAIQQQMDGATGRAWLPAKNRILVEVAQISENTSGLLAKAYTVNKNITVNSGYPAGFFRERIVIADSAEKRDDFFWDKNRPDSITNAEKSVYGMINDVKDIPAVKNYITIADLLINGYYKTGKISLGPFLQTYSYNNVEGNRLRLGFRTNSDFDKKWILGGYIAYGTGDNDFKYGGNVDYIISRKNWTEAGISFKHDLNQVALLSDNYLYHRNNLFGAFTGFGSISKSKVFFENHLALYIRRDLFRGFTEKISYANWSLNPLFPFSFREPNVNNISHELIVSEFQFESRWSPGVQALLSENTTRQVRLKSNVTDPVITFRYTLGLRNFLAGDNTYHKFSLNITQTLKMGILGRGNYSFSAGYIPSSVPYPLLENHLGNETFLYNPNAFNLMRFFEFASDRYASLSYTQHFEGLPFNSIPLIRDFNWRLVGTANILFGGMSAANQNNISLYNNINLRSFASAPYAEVGYGVENIFRFLRVDFIHRLTYLDNKDSFGNRPKRFGIKISVQFRL